MSNLFIIAAQTLTTAPPPSIPNLSIPASKPGPKPKPLAERSTLYALQLARYNTTPVTATADGLLAQFKANNDDESDSTFSANGDLRRRSYTREQKLAAISYATTKRV